ncbi:MAG: hypothetical protein LBL62_12370, partial [Planctomycetaceae bacterium]|nr:hypothetical protein [Planctomycetaceae bacterium]
KNKTVGMFYFLWNGFQGDLGPFDVTKILLQAPEARENANHPLWGPLMNFHHWGEPAFGYYAADDDYVLRKHAQMLADAGVDVLFFDVTNQKTYPESYHALCRVFMEMRKLGNRTPQIAFLCPFGQPARVVLSLWNDLYSKGEFSELWFRWKGKPLILADPSAIMPEKQDYVFLDKNEVIPIEAKPNIPLGQTFVVDRPLKKVALRAPTWQTNNAVASVTLFKEKPNGKELLSQRFINIDDNTWLTLTPKTPLPAGRYYLELLCEKGKIGWWSVADGKRIPDGQAFIDRKPVSGALTVRVTRIPEDAVVDAVLDFFTFRNPAVGYTQEPTKPDQWSWLQAYPQFGFYAQEDAPQIPGGKPKKIEQVSVSIAQNIVDGRMGTISSPRAYGRSFHNGKEPPPEDCDFTGKNFTEQWSRVFELDPEFVFVTGWNEWIMMRFPKGAKFHGADESEVNFIDQFNQEFSRDIEPMKGWHEDAFYYQLVTNIRKFKGVREAEPIQPQPITIDGNFSDWNNVTPEFLDTIGDPAQRHFRGCAKGLMYENKTGRNDIVAAKVSIDTTKQTLFFYVRTQEPIVGEKEANWMLLYLNIDANPKTGWLGYDFLLDGKTVKKCAKNEYQWNQIGTIESKFQQNEYEAAIPFSLLGLTTLPKSILFKWADNIQQTGDWSDFTLNGDAAPNDRYNYNAIFNKK